MKTAFLLPALFCALLAVRLPAAEPDDRRAEADKLMEKARMAKADGRAEEANELMERAKKIQAELHKGRRAGEKSAGDDRKLEHGRRELEELRRAGKMEEANRLEHHLAEAKRRMSDKVSPHAEGPERIRHIMEAVEHLRAAGLNEPAENLEKMARTMRAELERRAEAGGGFVGERMEGSVRELREQVEQLRRQLEKVQRQLEDLRSAPPRS